VNIPTSSEETLEELLEKLKSGWFSFSVEDHQHTFLLLDPIGSLGHFKRAEPEYRGELVDGEPEGLGVMVYVEPWKMYIGEWHKGKPHGKGFMNFSLSQRYVGEWEDGLRHGYGITVFEGRRMAVYYDEWKGQYVRDRWEGEDALEAQERQNFPKTMHFGSDARTAMEQFHETTEKVGDRKEAFRIRSRIEALDNLERAFQAGWDIFSHRYPKNFSELNRFILVKPLGIWCLICRCHVDLSEHGNESPVENAFNSTLAKQKAEDKILGRQLKTCKRMYESGFDRRDDAYYSLEQHERFVHQYLVLHEEMPGWMRQYFLKSYVQDRVSAIDQHLKEVHDWKLAESVSPDLDLNLRFS